mmetsp:Transcript_58207/g.142311  ORF Transcript_58207/g.142311 Transcript_58207/m.142311 type:complete len:321 (-) Transcript_58207:66-1028(-)
MDEPTHGGDALLGKVGLRLATGLVVLLTETVDLLVEFGTVMVAVLTGTCDRGRDAGGVPRTDTGDLSQTTVSLTRQPCDTPTGGNTLVPTTLRDTDDVDVLVLGEDGVDGDFLLEEGLGEVDLGGGVSAVDLDLHDVCLLDAQVQLLDLRVGDDPDDGTELLDTFEFGIDVLSSVLSVLLGVLGEGLLLGAVPVLVQTTLELFTQVLCEDGGKCPHASGSFDVSDDTDDDHGRGLDDRNSVDDFTLVHEGTGTVDRTDDVCHTGLVSTEGGEVRCLTGLVLGEGTDTAEMALGTLLRQETQVTTTGSFEFTVGHGCCCCS